MHPPDHGRRATRRAAAALMIATTALVVSACQPPGLASQPASAPSNGIGAPESLSAPAPVTPEPTTSAGTTGDTTTPAMTPQPPTSTTAPSSAVSTSATTSGAAAPEGTVFGVNDGSGYDTSDVANTRNTAEVARLGLTAVRMGMDGVGCERVGEPCNFARRDEAVQARLDRDIAIHATVAFRSELEVGFGEDEWVRNYGWKCGQIAGHYQGKVKYYIVDNETDLAYGDGQRGKVAPNLVVRMQQACYEAVKAVDTGIRLESMPATSPGTPYNRELLAAGIGNYADVVGTHLYGGQMDQGAIDTLRGYMADYDVDLPVACSECGVTPEWYTEGGEKYKGLTGNAARAQWLRDFAVHAEEKKLDNVLYFSMFSVHGDWEMDDDPLALDALYDIGHS